MRRNVTNEEIRFNQALGRVIRRRREQICVTQKQLAKQIGVTHQQFQKYECGLDGMTTYRLYQIFKILLT